jgi:uncharacterized membrane protein YsdA (DUF1294 family)
MSAKLLIGTIIFSIITLTTSMLSDLTHMFWFYSWLFSINVWSFFTYGYDKSRAIAQRYRVPNAVLLWLAILGGSIGSITGMYAFRHKTLMDRFQYSLYFFLSIQVLLGYFILKWSHYLA